MQLDGELAELRRAMSPAGTLVAGFFDGDAIATFDHKVTTAYFWPVEEFAARLQRAGFTEIERRRRPDTREPGNRPHAAIAARATGQDASKGSVSGPPKNIASVD